MKICDYCGEIIKEEDELRIRFTGTDPFLNRFLDFHLACLDDMGRKRDVKRVGQWTRGRKEK